MKTKVKNFNVKAELCKNLSKVDLQELCDATEEAILAGGGFKHGQHLAFNSDNNAPLANLYVSMLQNMGLDRSKFASSTGNLTGLS